MYAKVCYRKVKAELNHFYSILSDERTVNEADVATTTQGMEPDSGMNFHSGFEMKVKHYFAREIGKLGQDRPVLPDEI
jgi:hypothetical protein